MKMRIKENNGITLIALIVTVIILIILATVSIGGLMGDDGVINVTRSEKEEIANEAEERKQKVNTTKEDYTQAMSDKEKILKKEWTQTISGSGEDRITDFIETIDGGYIVVGYSTSEDIDWLGNNKGESDAFIVKYKINGEREWSASLGGNKADWFSGVIEDNDGYIVVGSTLSDTIETKTEEQISRGTGKVAGIIARYDKTGNELLVKIEQNTARNWQIEDAKYDYIIFTDIAKTADGYAITGKLDYNDDPSNTADLVLIEYNNNNMIQRKTKLWNGFNSGSVEKYSDYSVNSNTAHIKYQSSRYILFGNTISPNVSISKIAKIFSTDLSEEKAITYSENNGSAGRVYNIATDVIYDEKGKMIINLRNYLPSENKMQSGSICILDEPTNNETWIENGDYVAITQTTNSTFSTIKKIDDTTTKMQKYTYDGTSLGEYDMPNYNNIYKVGVDESYIFIGSPSNEQDVEIKGTEDAVISRYKLVDKQ